MIKVCPVCGRKNDGEGAVPLCHISLCQEAYEALTAERDRYKAALENIKGMYLCYKNPLKVEILGIVNMALDHK